MLEESILNLNKVLSRNSKVDVVYLSDKKSKSIHNRNIDYSRMVESMKHNMQMLCSIDIEDENKTNLDIIDHAKVVLRELDTEGLSKIEQIPDLVDTACKIAVFCVSFDKTRRISSLIDQNLELKIRSKNNTFFRGHSSSTYGLMPSIYRELKVEDGFDIVTSKKLENLYQRSHILDKYSEIFGNGEINYAFCAFLQHSKAYSPFLDFTEDLKIALSFATQNSSQLNNYYNSDAALYTISFAEELQLKDCIDISDLDILISNKKLTSDSIIRGSNLYYCTAKDFRVEAYLLKDKTNDRMKYQKGCFLYFQKCVIVNDVLLIPPDYGRISKYTIPPEGKTVNKLNIYRTILEKYPYYKYEYLMNPYKYFEEIPFI